MRSVFRFAIWVIALYLGFTGLAGFGMALVQVSGLADLNVHGDSPLPFLILGPPCVVIALVLAAWMRSTRSTQA